MLCLLPSGINNWTSPEICRPRKPASCAISSLFLLYCCEILRFFVSILPQNLQKVASTAIIDTSDPAVCKSTLDFRRCILLAVVGATPAGSPSVDLILANGYLDNVKSWLDDTLSSSEGRISFILCGLSCPVYLSHLSSSCTLFS